MTAPAIRSVVGVAGGTVGDVPPCFGGVSASRPVRERFVIRRGDTLSSMAIDAEEISVVAGSAVVLLLPSLLRMREEVVPVMRQEQDILPLVAITTELALTVA